MNLDWVDWNELDPGGVFTSEALINGMRRHYYLEVAERFPVTFSEILKGFKIPFRELPTHLKEGAYLNHRDIVQEVIRYRLKVGR